MQSVIVIGLGAMGSAAAQHLAQRGARVRGFDTFAPPHTHGSSHGSSRIIRQAYFEDRRYVPLLLRAYQLWRDLEAASGKSLLHITGCLSIGHAAGELVNRTAASAEAFSLPHQILSASELRQRHPAFAVRDDMAALWEPRGGYLLPEACITQQLAQAARSGAVLHPNEHVLHWSANPGGGVSVTTSAATYSADRLVLTAGPWAPRLLAEMHLPIHITRQVLLWFEPLSSPDLFRRDRLPVYLFEAPPGQPVLYGFPCTGAQADGVKVALHGSDEICTPESIDRSIRPSDEAAIRDRLRDALPLLAGRLLHAETCLYSMTPDENFLVDRHPALPQVALAAGFSGHGFKFASVIGEILADLTLDRAPAFDLSFLALNRFLSTPSSSAHPITPT